MAPYEAIHVASYYAALFPARNDVYSAWVEEVKGWRPVREPLTGEIVLAGLTGTGPSISGYMIAPDSESHVFAYDFDTDIGYGQAVTLARYMALVHLPAYVETSRRGAHLWCVMDEVLPAVTIRRAMRALLVGAGLPDNDVHIELRPGSDHVDAKWHPHVAGAVVGDGLGHALRLPMMPHPKTGQKGRMLDCDERSIGRTTAEAILAIEWAKGSEIRSWSERWKPKVRLTPKYKIPKDFPEDTSTASEILASLWGVHNARAGRSVRCPAHDDKVASLNILPDDKRALCMAGGCLLNNDDHGRGTYELRTLAPVAANG
jgi:hypothetical protein